jgi:predicted lactoylglutathione lyase
VLQETAMPRYLVAINLHDNYVPFVEGLLSLSCKSREEVDGLVAKAIAGGGSTHDKPQDYGFMYTHSFVDLDGHGWGLIHMSAMPA